MKYLLRPIALSFLWLSVGLACKKEELDLVCKDSQVCCGSSQYKATVVEYVNGEAAMLAGPPDFQWGLTLEKARGNSPKCPTASSDICPLSLEKVKDLTPSVSRAKREYKYRVWGTIFDIDAATLTCQPVHVMAIDRIEEIK